MVTRGRELTEQGLQMLRERHLASLSTPSKDGSIHVVPVGFTYDAEAASVWIITSGDSQKVRNVRRGGHAAVCQVAGADWISLSGPARILDAASQVQAAESRYAQRYRVPRENPKRVVIEIEVARILGSSGNVS